MRDPGSDEQLTPARFNPSHLATEKEKLWALMTKRELPIYKFPSKIPFPLIHHVIIMSLNGTKPFKATVIKCRVLTFSVHYFVAGSAHLSLVSDLEKRIPLSL